MAHKTLSIIGCGNLGTAILRGLLEREVFPRNGITLCDSDPEQLKSLGTELSIQTTTSASSAFKKSAVVILAVKPKDMPKLLRECAGGKDKTVISVAVAPSSSAMKQILGSGVSVVRVNPNVGAAVGLSMTSIYSDDDRAATIAEEIFSAVGLSVRIAEERQLDACSAVAASGPAFLYLAAQGMIDGAIKMGLTRDVARLLVMQTLVGAGALALESDLDCEELQSKIITPGGTTIEGMEQLEEDGVRGSFMKAVARAAKRMGEITAALEQREGGGVGASTPRSKAKSRKR